MILILNYITFLVFAIIFHLLARKPNLEKKIIFILANSFIIFTCPNPVLLVPASGKWVNAKTAFYLYIEIGLKFLCKNIIRKHFDCVKG